MRHPSHCPPTAAPLQRSAPHDDLIVCRPIERSKEGPISSVALVAAHTHRVRQRDPRDWVGGRAVDVDRGRVSGTSTTIGTGVRFTDSMGSGVGAL